MTEIGQFMIWISGCGKNILVTGIAVGGCIIVAAAMAINTSDSQMGTGQREYRGAVIKSCRLPRCIGMTNSAGLIEIISYMIGVDHRPEISLMAAKTIIGCASIGGCVTLCAAHVDVGTGQGIGGRVVSKGAWLPARNGVTGRTGDIKITHTVIRIGLRIVFVLVAAVTGPRCAAISRRMAIDTGYSVMCSC
jgi:hypothetical protein